MNEEKKTRKKRLVFFDVPPILLGKETKNCHLFALFILNFLSNENEFRATKIHSQHSKKKHAKDQCNGISIMKKTLYNSMFAFSAPCHRYHEQS